MGMSTEVASTAVLDAASPGGISPESIKTAAAKRKSLLVKQYSNPVDS